MRLSPEPTYPLALGLLVAAQRHPGAAVAEGPDAQARELALTQTIAERDELARAADALRREQLGLGRTLAEANQALAEVLPKLDKLRADSQALRVQQEQALVQQEMQRFRRQRAELNVRIQDLDVAAQSHQERAQAARAKLADAQREQLRIGDILRQTDATLADLQQQSISLPARMAQLEHQLGLAHAQLFVACNEPQGPSAAALLAWVTAVGQMAEATLDVHDAMAQGRFAERQMLAYRGGRARLCGEVVWALIALGDWAGARLAYGRMCGAAAPLHQMDAVFRAHSGGLILGGEAELERLAEMAAMHRFEQTERGALAQAVWYLLDEHQPGFVRAQRTLCRAEWQARQREGKEALGLISVTSLGLCRLAQERGTIPDFAPGPQVPAVALLKLPPGAKR